MQEDTIDRDISIKKGPIQVKVRLLNEVKGRAGNIIFRSCVIYSLDMIKINLKY